MTLSNCAQEAHPQSSATVDHTFGLHVFECVHCPACDLKTHRNDYIQYFYTVSATALRTVAAAFGSTSTGQLLRMVEEQVQKSCDTDVGGCNVRYSVRHSLTHAPRVFTLQLAWESNSEARADILGTLEAVQETLKVQDMYAELPADAPSVYTLRSMVAYYGSHYLAFVMRPDLEVWVMFDDAAVTKIGTWAQVVRKCHVGRIQPSVLFYVAQ